MLRLNSQSQQYDGFTPWVRVPGRTPKMPSGAAYIPIFLRFREPEGPAGDTDTSSAFETEGLRKHLTGEIFPMGFNLSLNHRVRDMEKRRILVMENCLFLPKGRRK